MIYNTLAHYYDALVKDEEASREWVSWIESELAPCDCLELACGSGEITEMLAQKGYTMTALDLSEEMVKQAKSKILNLAIHGKLVPQDPNDEPAIELLKRINPDFTPCDNGHYTQLPEGWAICKMKQITSITNGKSQKNVETLNGIYPIYGSGGVIGRANQYLCIAGSTIIGRKGTINNPIFVEEHFWNVDTAFGLKANDAILDKYLYYFCLSFDFSKLDKSTAMPSLTKTSIGNVLIPIPPYKEQERIVAKIDMVLDTMNEILRAV